MRAAVVRGPLLGPPRFAAATLCPAALIADHHTYTATCVGCVFAAACCGKRGRER